MSFFDEPIKANNESVELDYVDVESGDYVAQIVSVEEDESKSGYKLLKCRIRVVAAKQEKNIPCLGSSIIHRFNTHHPNAKEYALKDLAAIAAANDVEQLTSPQQLEGMKFTTRIVAEEDGEYTNYRMFVNGHPREGWHEWSSASAVKMPENSTLAQPPWMKSA